MASRLLIFPFLGALLIGGLLSSCENDIKQLRKISEQENSKPVDRTTGVDIIFSDSSHVKLHLVSPLMLQYNNHNTGNTATPAANPAASATDKSKNPYMVMPKGVKGTFYDDSLRVSSTIVADSAIRREREQLIELYKHVVATNQKGDVFKSDELIYNQATHKVTSSKPVTITSANGDVINGDGLVTNEKFSPWTLSNTRAVLMVNKNIEQQ